MQKSHNNDFFKKPFAAVALETGVLSTKSHYEIAIRGFKCNLCRTEKVAIPEGCGETLTHQTQQQFCSNTCLIQSVLQEICL